MEGTPHAPAAPLLVERAGDGEGVGIDLLHSLQGGAGAIDGLDARDVDLRERFGAEAPRLHGTAPARRQEFARALTAAGFFVTIRYSLGADIAAACGQLVRHENLQIR